MDQAKYLELIGRYLAKESDAAETAALLDWAAQDPANRELFDELTRLWGWSGAYAEEELPLAVAPAWARLEETLEAAAAPGAKPLRAEAAGGAKVIPLRRWRGLLRYAAALALLMLAGYWLLTLLGGPAAAQWVELSTGPSEQQTHLLPDGSTVILNENTRLVYPPSFEERQLQLVGEAFFEVVRQDGKNFTVEAGGSTTTVLGTAFNLRAYPGEGQVEVSVRSGQVAVAPRDEAAQSVLLQAGQAAVYDQAAAKVEKRAAPNADAWMTGELVFEQAPLGEVLEALRRYFKAEIEVANPQLLNCRFKGEFIQPAGVQEVLEALAFTMELELQQQDGRYRLAGDASRCQ